MLFQTVTRTSEVYILAERLTLTQQEGQKNEQTLERNKQDPRGQREEHEPVRGQGRSLHRSQGEEENRKTRLQIQGRLKGRQKDGRHPDHLPTQRLNR